MSEPWPSLLAAVVGAIVGGTFSLLGTMLVNKRQMATNARLRLHDELLPQVEDRIDSLLAEVLDPVSAAEAELAGEQMPELLKKVRRVSAIAGRFERRAAHNLWILWIEHVEAPTRGMRMELPKSVNADPVDPSWKPPPSPAQHRLGRIQAEIRAFSDALEAKL